MGLLLCAGLLGCEEARPALGPLYEVKGKVELPDGKSLSGGQVYFVRADGGSSSLGKVGSDGTFALTTAGSGGAPPGDYKIRVEPEDLSTLPGKRKAGKKLAFPAKYLDEDSSELKVTIKAEANQLETFRLK
jgi:hypothetical protein